MAFSGDSGQGKSWRLAALGRATVSEPGLVVALRASGIADLDLAEVARTVCQDGLEQTDTKPFALLTDWRRRVAPDAPKPWLTILIDGVQQPEEEARSLLGKPWTEWGIRLAFTTSAAIGTVLRQDFRDEALVVEVPDFDDDELRDFLGRHGREWGAVPTELRQTLRRPLLAALYCRLGEGTLWQPTREYELYELYWERLRSARNQALYAEDQARMRSLALQLLGPDPVYPWTYDSLQKAGITDEPLRRLETIGWLRRLDDGRYEVWHSRLLNWAVAEALVAEHRAGRLTSGALKTRLTEFMDDKRLYAGQSLAYASMDTLWLLSGRDAAAVNVVAEAIAGMDTAAGQSSYPDRFYRYVLSTLGRRLIPALIARVRMSEDLGANPFPRLVASVVRQTAQTDPSEAQVVAALAGDPNAAIQALAEHVVALFPSAEALDPIWSRQAAGILGGTSKVDVEEFGRRTRRRSALIAAARLAPAWVVDRINDTDDPSLLKELAALIRSLDADKSMGTWTTVKARLFERLPQMRAGVLADCIAHFDDREEVARLESWLTTHNRPAGRAFVALARLDPARALAALSTVPINALSSTAAEWLPLLAVQRPGATDTAVRQRLASSNRATSWDLAERLFRGHEWLVGPEVTEFLLESLAETLQDGVSQAKRSGLRIVLHVLAGVASREALMRFEVLAGSALADDLSMLARSWVRTKTFPRMPTPRPSCAN